MFECAVNQLYFLLFIAKNEQRRLEVIWLWRMFITWFGMVWYLSGFKIYLKFKTGTEHPNLLTGVRESSLRFTRVLISQTFSASVEKNALILQVLKCSAHAYWLCEEIVPQQGTVKRRKYQVTSLVIIPNALKQQPLYPWIEVLLLGKMSMFSIYSFYLS